MPVITAYKTTISSINTLTVEIEETFSDNYSVIAYDNEGLIFDEKFTKTLNLDEAQKLSKKLHDKNLSKLKSYN